MAPPRPLRRASTGVNPTCLRTLGAQLKKLGGQIVLGARAHALIMDGLHCTGVRGESAGAECAWPAGAVVIADGGFQADTSNCSGVTSARLRSACCSGAPPTGAATGC